MNLTDQQKDLHTPDDPWGKNPFPEGTRWHQVWKEISLWVKEHLALFHSEMLESMPPEEASSKEFLDHHLKALAGTFDIWAGAFSRSAVLTDDAADAFEHLLTELETAMVAQASKHRLGFIPERLHSSEVKRQLNQRKHYWTGQMLRKGFENTKRRTARVLGANTVDGAEPSSAGSGNTTPKPQEAASVQPATGGEPRPQVQAGNPARLAAIPSQGSRLERWSYRNFTLRLGSARSTSRP